MCIAFLKELVPYLPLFWEGFPLRCWNTAAGNCSHFNTSINVWHTAFCILFVGSCASSDISYWPYAKIGVTCDVQTIEESFSARCLWGFKWLDESINRTAIWIVDLLPELLHLPYMDSGRSHWWTDLLLYRCFDSIVWPCTSDITPSDRTEIKTLWLYLLFSILSFELNCGKPIDTNLSLSAAWVMTEPEERCSIFSCQPKGPIVTWFDIFHCEMRQSLKWHLAAIKLIRLMFSLGFFVN